MRLAIVGKGGAGKTSLAGTMARLLARRGRRVLAIDGDPNPTLGFTLGVSPEQVGRMPAVGPELVERTDNGFQLTKTLEEVYALHSLEGPDGVKLLATEPQQRAGTG
jgi:CO dehydrogenase maturation factor